MNSKKILLRVDANTSSGIGHFSRCLSLSLEMKKKGYKPYFVGNISLDFALDLLHNNNIEFYNISFDEKSYCKNIVEENKNFEFKTWAENRQISDFEIIKNNFNLNTFALIIVDNYHLDKTWEEEFLNETNNLIVIDDLNNRPHHCKILIDQGFNKKSSEYNGLVNKECRLLVGSKYFMMNENFIRYKKLRRVNKNKISKVTLNFGGSNFNNLVNNVCTELSKIKIFNEYVILLNSLDHLRYIDNYIKKDDRFKFLNLTSNYPQLLSETKIAIGASGTSTWERLFMGVPSFQFILAENQRKVCDQLDNSGYLKRIDKVNDLNRNIMSWYDGQIVFKEFDAIDGLGVKRIMEEIQKII